MKASYQKYTLQFKRPSGTSRGILTEKETWFILLEDTGRTGIGECGILRGLSVDDRGGYEEKLKWACNNIHLGKEALYDALMEFPSIQFGIEQAFSSLKSRSSFILFPSRFTEGSKNISINGLVWMGDKAFMQRQIREKLEQGFRCIKMKIGAIDFGAELELLRSIREEFSPDDIEIRVDANGAFTPGNALEKLKKLSELSLHSIEQPIKQGQWEEMAVLCENSPLPIALDEELIGVFDFATKKELVNTIKPQYIILKPSLVGGFRGSKEWIQLAENCNTDWWITSALESNVGLNAIAQWTYTLNNTMPQGLGTGSLYTNNLDSPLKVKHGELTYDPSENWNISVLKK
ncbi:o-succinylbenzoate synthase [Sinomicrobium weinanense]|uniref:O-succinylbenzoate synthase n=1 Tax=Sinomicrobium weinanense TaxID=2842200 RepID=A0A926Q4N0_9FLAO|nr:o-succinylbenzoate synthase [Sinomicrobium weinanense]MBC9797261.1 o-succinylbenzoate synthase [Sinomicrobium weinanense]MBU3122337.1 o-succinylbenzoate synthase [Sinomicrobium weinanense]